MAKIKRSNSHRHRKFNRYTGDVSKRRRRRSIGLWWIIPLAALAAFILALLLGRFLGSQVDEIPETTGQPSSDASPSLPPAISEEIESIDAIFVTLEGVYDYTYDAVSNQIPEGTSAISLHMFYSNGAPIYKSEVAEDCGKPSGELTLKNIFKYPLENGIYVSVPFPSSALSSEDTPASSITSAYEAELIKELALAGADEILIKCKYDALDSDFILRIANYITLVKLSAPDIHVGFIISTDDVKSTQTIDSVCRYADFCAVDMSGMENAEDMASFIESELTNILRYNMRVLIKGNTPEAYALLDSLGIKNRQVFVK